MSATKELFLDERLSDDLWVKGRAAYPHLTPEQHLILKEVAEQLCVSQAKLEWAFYDGAHGDDSGWKRLRKRLMSPPVKMITRA